MAKLKDRIQNVLDEARMLVLGSQVLLGFQYRSFFEPGFVTLSQNLRYIAIGALACLLLALAMLMSPAAHHQLVEGGRDTSRLHRYATVVIGRALLPFALGLAAGIFLVTDTITGIRGAVIAGAVATVVALFFWYGLEVIKRKHRRLGKVQGGSVGEMNSDQEESADLTDLIRQVLTEARVVIPGAQALIGFQLTIALTPAFAALPKSSKYVHLASLGMMALSIIFLMTPAAYHRIVEQGHGSWEFLRFSRRMLLAAMIPLPLGISGDFFVVAREVLRSDPGSVAAAIVVLAMFYGFWFGLRLFLRPSQLRALRSEGSPPEPQN